MKKIKITRLLPVLCGIVCFIYHPGAIAQTVVNINPLINPVIRTNINTVVNSSVNRAINANINPIINSAVNANVSSAVNANVNPVINANVNNAVNTGVNENINPEINVDVNPDVNIDGDNDHSEGSWFATIHGDKISIEFRGSSKDGDDDEHSWSNGATFNLSDFPALPKDAKADFTLKREAGSTLFTGKFEGDEGFGHYKFTADNSFTEFIKSHNVADVRDRHAFAFFLVDLQKSYVSMLQKNGYNELTANNLIAIKQLIWV